MTDVVDSETRSRMMSGIRGKDTKPELEIRRQLHRLGTVFAQPEPQAASKQWRQVADGLRGRFAKAAACMDAAEEDVLEQNDDWQVCRRYLSLESLTPLIGNDDINKLIYNEAA